MAKLAKEMALTYDDVLIKPGFSEILPQETNTETKFSKNITLKIPIVSAAMDTVTEAPSAIVLAEEGGIGVIHKNLNPYRQAEEVEKVKKFEAGMILNPVSVDEDTTLKEAHIIAQEIEEKILESFSTAEILIHQDPFGIPERVMYKD